MTDKKFNVRDVIFAKPTQQPSLECVLMAEGTLDVIETLDGISTLPNQHDRSVALNMLLSQLQQHAEDKEGTK
jgi:hypothetical protein